MIDLKKEFEKFHVQKRISGFSKTFARVYFEAGFNLISGDLREANELIEYKDDKIAKLEGQIQQLKKEYAEILEENERLKK